MKKNIGNVDKVIRVTLAIILVSLYFKNVITGTLAVASLVLALVLVITSVMSFCGLYTVFGISTHPEEDKHKK